MSLAGFALTAPAEQEIGHILRASAERFGEAASLRYESLIIQAILDLVADPGRTGVRADGLRIYYHLRHSRHRVAGDRVKEPRHILVCTVTDRVLVVLAIGHDAMEPGLALRIAEGEGAADQA